jgi:hypothetical protein
MSELLETVPRYTVHCTPCVHSVHLARSAPAAPPTVWVRAKGARTAGCATRPSATSVANTQPLPEHTHEHGDCDRFPAG